MKYACEKFYGLIRTLYRLEARTIIFEQLHIRTVIIIDQRPINLHFESKYLYFSCHVTSTTKIDL